MIVPTMRTWVEDEIVTPQDLNEQIRDAIGFLLNPPHFEAINEANQTFLASSATTVEFPTVLEDTDGIWDTVTNVATIVTPGIYEFGYVMHMNASGSLSGSMRATINVPTDVSPSGEVRQEIYMSTESNGRFSHIVRGIGRFGPGQTLEPKYYQNSGSSVDSNSTLTPANIWARWIAA